MPGFTSTLPLPESYWRSVILYGRNVASYKFALGEVLLDLASEEREIVPLEDLAVPYAAAVCRHLALADTQATSSSSRFLDACRKFNRAELTADELRALTVQLGFQNVIDAFHIVGTGEVGARFFSDERTSSAAGIRLTDVLLHVAKGEQAENLTREVEARWRLVETSWDLKMPARALAVEVEADELIVRPAKDRRVSITRVRDALNGYQRGRCFYCHRPVRLAGEGPEAIQVDHFLPWSLKQRGYSFEVDRVWNLVVACLPCNATKSARVPVISLAEQLHGRNEGMIRSHHPLRETLIGQLGASTEQRRSFLISAWSEAAAMRVPDWDPQPEGPR